MKTFRVCLVMYLSNIKVYIVQREKEINEKQKKERKNSIYFLFN
jgi:hypothetical protein